MLGMQALAHLCPFLKLMLKTGLGTNVLPEVSGNHLSCTFRQGCIVSCFVFRLEMRKVWIKHTETKKNPTPFFMYSLCNLLCLCINGKSVLFLRLLLRSNPSLFFPHNYLWTYLGSFTLFLQYTSLRQLLRLSWVFHPSPFPPSLLSHCVCLPQLHDSLHRSIA